MPLPDALLLDLDGTLVDSEPIHAESIARALASSGVELTLDERAYVWGHAWQDIYRELHVERRTGIGLRELQELAVLEKTKMFMEGVRLPILPGATELVRLATAMGLPVAIVSGSCRAEIEQMLPHLGIADELAFFLGAEDYPRGKPAPDSYLTAAARLLVKPASCVVIEDSEAGIAAGLTAGMRVLASRAGNPPHGTHGHQDQGRAHRVVDDLACVAERDLRALMDPD